MFLPVYSLDLRRCQDRLVTSNFGTSTGTICVLLLILLYQVQGGTGATTQQSTDHYYGATKQQSSDQLTDEQTEFSWLQTKVETYQLEPRLALSIATCANGATNFSLAKQF